jgi:hypothetical protein
MYLLKNHMPNRTGLELCQAGQLRKQESPHNLVHPYDCFHLTNSTGCAIKNRWNWMVSGKRKNVFEKVVLNNSDLFRRVYQA